MVLLGVAETAQIQKIGTDGADAVHLVIDRDGGIGEKFGQFITDIGIYDNDEAPECRHLFFMLHGMILHNYSSSISIMALSSTSIMISAADVALLSFS